MNNSVLKNYKHLKQIFRVMKQVLIAYSGGVDSALLLRIGTEVLGKNCAGVLGISPSLASEEKNQAIRFAQTIDAQLEIIETRELENPAYVQNDMRRCFYCKKELFTELWDLARQRSVQWIVDGTNADDVTDYRPGIEAARSLQVRSPLLEAGLSKNDIRELSRYLKIPFWNKPAQPCLSSRIMYGQSIDAAVLSKIDRAEQFIRNRGYRIVRVRYLGSVASVEVGSDEVGRLQDKQESYCIERALKEIGFEKVQFDPEGYRQGKLNTEQ